MNKSFSAGQRIFCPQPSVRKMGNTYSIPAFSIPCLETKSLAASSRRFNQSSLTVQTDAKSQKYLLIRFPQSVLHTHPSNCTAIRQPTDNPPKAYRKLSERAGARLPSKSPLEYDPAFP